MTFAPTFLLFDTITGENSKVPADGTASWQDVAAAASVATVVGLQLADAAAGLAINRQEAWLAHTACLLGVGVDLAARKLSTCQEFTGVGLIGWRGGARGVVGGGGSK